MPTAVHRAARRVGRRGAILILKGIMSLLFGCSLLLQPLPNPVGIRLLLKLMPAHFWGWAWVVAGCTALVCTVMRPGRDWAGFAAVYLMSSSWSLAYLTSWWLYGNSRGWITAIIFAAFGGVAAVAAAWPEPQIPPKEHAHER